MNWQSIIIASVQVYFAYLIFVTLRDPNARVPRKTSVPTAIGLYVIASVYVTLSLWVAVAAALVCGSMWLAVAIYRPTLDPLKEWPESFCRVCVRENFIPAEAGGCSCGASS